MAKKKVNQKQSIQISKEQKDKLREMVGKDGTFEQAINKLFEDQETLKTELEKKKALKEYLGILKLKEEIKEEVESIIEDKIDDHTYDFDHDEFLTSDDVQERVDDALDNALDDLRITR